MIELDNLKPDISFCDEAIKELNSSLNIDVKQKRIKELEMMMQDTNFWNDVLKANNLNKELKSLTDSIDTYNELVKNYNDILSFIDIVNADNDKSLINEIISLIDNLKKKIEDMKLSLLLSGEYDKLDAIVKLNAGSGGTESCDFCSMLYRMYMRYATKHKFSVEILDYLDGDEAGIKSVSFIVKGYNAYGYMKSEMGVHRLVRISPFNAQGKRQTSFVGCDVMPDIKEDLDIDIRSEDIKMDVYRASGAGGQHINKTSSAVRLTHIPTGIVVACQAERSQFANKEQALKMLKTKLYILKEKENKEKLSGIRGVVKDNAFGSQIRSYVLQPYRMVKDLRTGDETGNTDSVLDGDIDLFVNGYLKWLSLGCPDRKVLEND